MRIRRINLYGGPGSRKSTYAHGICNALKKEAIDIEFPTEIIKGWVYEKKMPKSYDEFYLISKQMIEEDRFLRGGAEYVICDAPLAIYAFYAKYYNFDYWNIMVDMVNHYDKCYKGLNIFINVDRDSQDYNPLGRYQTKEEAKEADAQMLDFLTILYSDDLVILPQDEGIVSDYVFSALKIKARDVK